MPILNEFFINIIYLHISVLHQYIRARPGAEGVTDVASKFLICSIVCYQREMSNKSTTICAGKFRQSKNNRYVVKPAPSVPAPTFPAPNFWGRNGSALHPFRPQLYRPQYKNATISILVKIATDCNHSGPSQKCINIGHSHINFITLEI